MIRLSVKLFNWVSRRYSVPWTRRIDPETLISDRAQEQKQKIREKLRLDMQVIRKRRTKEKPFPVGSFEMLQANSIWEIVLEHLTEPCDITNAYFACPLFQEILEDKRKLILLPETLKIMKESEIQRNDGVQRRLNFLRLRGASKKWRKVVDREIFEASFLEDSTWYLKLENKRDWDVYFDRPDSLRLTWINEVESALSSLASSKDTSSSPLRKLCIWRLYPDSEKFMSAVDRLLDSHGDCIWLLVFYGKEELADYDHLCRLLRKLPRLKALILHSVTKSVRDSSPQELVNLQVKLEQNPFPRLDSLIYLHLEWNVSPLLLPRIYRKCPNLKSVSEGHKLDIAWRESSRRRLSLGRYRTMLPRLIVTSRLSWQLKVLEVPACYDNTPVTCSSWWPALNRFRGTLEYLTIPGIERDDPNVQLQVDRVKVFKIGLMTRRTVGFDDFLNLKSLEKLSISSLDEKALHFQNKSGLVQVAGFPEKMKQSNIWQCFGDLRQLEIKINTLRRKFVRHGSTLSRYSRDETGEGLWVLEGASGLINANMNGRSGECRSDS